MNKRGKNIGCMIHWKLLWWKKFYVTNVIPRSARKFLSIFLQKIWARICEETNIWDLVKRDPYVLRFGLFPPLNGGRGFSPSSRQAVRDETYRSKLLQISRAWGVQFLLPLIFTTACKVGITWARPLILCHTKGWVVPPGILHQFVSHLSQTEQTEHGGSFYA